DERAVAVGRIDEVDIELAQASQCVACAPSVFGIAPDPPAGEAHGAETKSMDRDVAAHFELSRFRGRTLAAHDASRFSLVRSRRAVLDLAQSFHAIPVRPLDL